MKQLFFLLALCACSAPAAPPLTIGGALPNRVTTSIKSWISPDLTHTSAPVLFVSDSGSKDVYIYNMTTLKVIGTITGFNQPQGECSDNKGNVWVTDANGQIIYELSHQGQLETELNVTGGYPDGCAWDPTTGNLAVMELFGVGSVSGAVLIYPKASGSPKSYRNPGQYYYNFGGYDAGGDLFFDGRDANGKFMLAKLPKGAGSAYTLTLTGGTIYFPGMVQWDSAASRLLVGDQSCGNLERSCVYSVKIAKTSGAITGRIKLLAYKGSAEVCDMVQGVEFSKQIFGSDFNFCGYTPSTTYVWPYPAGGAPTHYNKTTDSVPVGAAISQ